MVYINVGDGVYGGVNGDLNNAVDHWDDYMGIVHPDVVSYDYYHFRKSSDQSPYSYLLSKARDVAQQAGVPLMNMVQATGWAIFRIPNANELRFLANTTLAYGGTGISYFNYWRFEGGIGGIEPYPDGSDTAVYTALKTINPQFVAIGSQIQSLTSIGAYHMGDRPAGTRRLPGNSPFTITPPIEDTVYADNDPVAGMLLGVFGPVRQLEGATFALAVNLDYVNETTRTIDGPGLLSVFEPVRGVWTATGLSSVEVTLEPGGCVLVGLTGEAPVP